MQIGNDEAAHKKSNPKNARKTGDPQADAFRQGEFEQELCRFVDWNEIGRPPDKVANPSCELRYRPVKFILARTAAEGAARGADLAGSTAALLSGAA